MKTGEILVEINSRIKDYMADEYEKAVDEMLVRTSTSDAPWIIVEGNDKYYARIKVLEAVVEAIEKRISLIKE